MLAMLQPSSPSAKRDLPSVLGALHGIYATKLPAVLAARMVRHGLAKDTAEAAAPVDRLMKAVASSLSKFLTQRAAQLAAAVAEPPGGVTISITFSELTKGKLGGELPAPEVSVHSGWKYSGQ
ncbi:hypothetical protein PJ267_02355 [Arthrobacter sp. OVS8]|nr:hypothetical protein PJ267_02355 [Arthrobacter sp. OVS8]